MIYIPLQNLRAGMILARSVSYGSSALPLVVAGATLSDSIILKLIELNVPGAYIESKFGADIVAEDFIEPELKQKMTTELKDLYTDYVGQSTFSNAMVASIGKMAQSLMMYVLSKDKYLVNIIEIKGYDTYTYSHSLYVGILSMMIGMQLGLASNDLAELALCGMLHDIGKLDISVDIINKPSALTDEEFSIIKEHPACAVERLKATHQFSMMILKGIESHHEKYDGTGYPFGLKGKSIPLYGRILALADVYDALTSVRSYRRAWLPNEVIEYMMGCATSHFDFEILQAFLKVIAAYPVGTLVKLSNGMLAVVTENTPDHALRPCIRLLTPKEVAGTEVDLSADRTFLSATIIGTVTDTGELPEDFFE